MVYSENKPFQIENEKNFLLKILVPFSDPHTFLTHHVTDIVTQKPNSRLWVLIKTKNELGYSSALNKWNYLEGWIGVYFEGRFQMFCVTIVLTGFIIFILFIL